MAAVAYEPRPGTSRTLKIFNKYIARNLLVTQGMALGILVFVMLSGHLFRAFDLLAQGVSLVLLGKMLGFLVPDILRYALPLSLLVSVVLVFSRMSADNEIGALKSGGVSLWQMMMPGLYLSVFLSVVCLWMSLELVPEFRFRSKRLQWEALSGSPLAMLEPGRVCQLSSNLSVRIGRHEGETLQDIHLLETEDDGNVLRDVTAGSGMLIQKADRSYELVLHDFTLSETSFTDEQRVESLHGHTFLSGNTVVIPIEYAEAEDGRPLRRKMQMTGIKSLFGDMQLAQERGLPLIKYRMELHSRLALAMTPLAFFLLGLPFGIRSRRSETSTGLLICVILALVFYAFQLLGDCLENNPALHPEYIFWIPIVAYQIWGIVAISRLNKH